MINKKIMFITIILIGIFALSAVSAAENVTEESVGIDDSPSGLDSNSDLSAINYCDDLKTTESNDVLAANSNTFTDSDDIKDNATVNLNECYAHSSTDAVINGSDSEDSNGCWK